MFCDCHRGGLVSMRRLTWALLLEGRVGSLARVLSLGHPAGHAAKTKRDSEAWSAAGAQRSPRGEQAYPESCSTETARSARVTMLQ